MSEHYIIAIDGPAGSGKSSTAAIIAKELSIVHLDTGAMYRAFTLAALEKGVPVSNREALMALSQNIRISFTREETGGQRIFLDGRDVTTAIRSAQVTSAVSEYCAVPEVREFMVHKQREAVRDTSLVCEGRDIGTVVFPRAAFKFFLTASINERTRRRMRELAAKGVVVDEETVKQDIEERDRRDSTRTISPLRPAGDAEIVDTTDMTLVQQAGYVINTVKNNKK
ncbi:MAG: cytidylate kinase [Candidatus Raymondbacteria bacterium RifOxyA12_full_50_37]|uniref:Cytidylate kinase n=1 Tax=Candidatus Raymondbacteria bacterium RIFOXYD12_FULL_49_13 TaxID=1817890 RepID=A0A1F7FCJ5_UNCRA|nr:MAG: cytidylate kinase [Candidatus Raymondbacteria bacterium RifOxyA12_full_50_37]OGJ86307.1 MAG: cytidylate kinase [Candidatus Raymondbacteria bacterium RIFOXYA2_FULL_49_16]OGJ89990.1 MAG: cytidylate kinase [Candidatus Raymondbacteria bacterium RifOxyB12_full_50_8]OGJ95845.1 MAG: cytidylate kinase [Candidatus Raymondbacteria bacterium RIFOXYC2_FULL_50_21]OGK04410.1 MAG: cytidylate kinase [Candidatus Raymondbacteria bacterium RIFOXYD12_FULL_49_13]OGP42760.1 MAG: cytidylate kinase [Candidatu